MENISVAQPTRLHPLMTVAAVSVTLVSLIGVAAITGILPASHSSAVSSIAPASSAPLANESNVFGTPARLVTPDGKVFEQVSGARYPASLQTQVADNAPVYEAAPAPRQAPVRQATVRRHVVHHAPAQYVQHSYAANTYAPEPTYERRVEQQPAYSAPAHPVVNYINDMHPVGTGVGAVLGGVLGNQVGGGNGKKLATVAGVLFGGYAGNEVAHNRSPLPGQ